MSQFSDQLNIETPELVDLELPLAGVGSRFIAVLIDTIIFIVANVVLTLVGLLLVYSFASLSRISGTWAYGVYLLFQFLLQWGYFTLFEGLWNGRTPGKRVAKIRVIHKSGRAIGMFEAITRNFIRVVDQIPFIYGVGLIFVFATKQHQRLGDLAAGTLVVREQEMEAPAWAENGSRTFTASLYSTPSAPSNFPPALPTEIQLAADGLAKLDASDLGVLEGFFARRLDMTIETRASLATRITQALVLKSSLAIPEGISNETFLETIARQLREVVRFKN